MDNPFDEMYKMNLYSLDSDGGRGDGPMKFTNFSLFVLLLHNPIILVPGCGRFMQALYFIYSDSRGSRVESYDTACSWLMINGLDPDCWPV